MSTHQMSFHPESTPNLHQESTHLFAGGRAGSASWFTKQEEDASATSSEASLEHVSEPNNRRALLLVLAVMISNTVVQFTMAILGNSLTVLGDAIAGVWPLSNWFRVTVPVVQVIDCLTYLANWFAEKYASDNKWLPHAAAALSMLLLIGVSSYVLAESTSRLNENCHPSEDDCSDVEPG